MLFVGIDQHKRHLTVCVRSEQGEIVLRGQGRTGGRTGHTIANEGFVKRTVSIRGRCRGGWCAGRGEPSGNRASSRSGGGFSIGTEILN